MREISFVVYVHTLMTQKSAQLGWRNAILRNHLKISGIISLDFFVGGREEIAVRPRPNGLAYRRNVENFGPLASLFKPALAYTYVDLRLLWSTSKRNSTQVSHRLPTQPKSTQVE